MDNAVAETGSTANSYQVLAKLATGGMAEIYLARGAGVAGVSRYVVMKRVLRDHATDIHFLQMFLDEARLAAQLQHPNIAQVYDVGKLGDSFFFTMEYIHGDTVRAILQRAHALHRSPPLACVLAIASGAAAGLHHAHERIGVDGRPLDIVHRDVSPTNLMVGFDGSVKLVDFGVAKVADRVHETRSGAVKGKIGYLSPEQARGQRLDRRSDLYSLGIVMWEMLTLERLYKRDNDFDAMSAIINDPTSPPSRYRHDIPPALDRLVMRALAKSADERFQTAAELGDAIEAVAVETGSALSSAGLARFLRELFGTRPEPWVAVTEQAKGEVVTVTSEPIPAKLRVPTHDPVDRRLADVVDLSTVTPGETTSALFATARERPAAIAAGRKRRWAWIAGGGAIGVIAAIVVVVVAMRGPAAEPATTDSHGESIDPPTHAVADPSPTTTAPPPTIPSPIVTQPSLIMPSPTATTPTVTSTSTMIPSPTPPTATEPSPTVTSPSTTPTRAGPPRSTTRVVKPPPKKLARPTASQCATDPMACPH